MAPTRQCLLDAARLLFAARGYDGVAVREICSQAGTASTAIQYHFGSKMELYRQILAGFSGDLLAPAASTLEARAQNLRELQLLLGLFCKQALQIYLENRELLQLSFEEFARDRADRSVDCGRLLAEQSRPLARFLRAHRDFLRPDQDTVLLANRIIEALATRARFSGAMERCYGIRMQDRKQAEGWVEAELELLFSGALSDEARSGIQR